MSRARIGLGVWLLLAASLTGCQDPVYANHAYYEIDGDERIHKVSGCTPVGDWRSADFNGGGGSADGDLRFEHIVASDTLQVEISSQGARLEQREYSEARLRSGKRDQFTIVTAAGRSIEVNYWGDDKCEASAPEE